MYIQIYIVYASFINTGKPHISSMKFHFISSVVMTFIVGFMALNENLSMRVMLILPVILFYQLTFIMFQVECDVLYKVSWSAKEKKLRKCVAEETAEKVVRHYMHQKPVL